jgi:catechol 2,3-dioxygenase-like lactoylglutathione lyase family enzyme
MEAEMSSESATGSPPVKAGEVRLEVVVVPVSDVDRAKRFYETLGWRLDADLAVDDGYRVVRLTPPGSACSIIFGNGVTSAPPGPITGLSPPSAIRTATAGCSRRSRRGFRAAERRGRWPRPTSP